MHNSLFYVSRETWDFQPYIVSRETLFSDTETAEDLIQEIGFAPIPQKTVQPVNRVHDIHGYHVTRQSIAHGFQRTVTGK